MNTEDLIPIKQVSAYFSSRPTRGTIERWRAKGLLVGRRRVKLVTRMEGGRRYVSPRAIREFKRQTNR